MNYILIAFLSFIAFSTPSYAMLKDIHYEQGNENTNPELGVASWYGGKFHGRKTASGERFNMYNLTAAHPDIPLNTYVKVTNVQNGQNVVVKINDRGPFIKGRIIDLSYQSAKKIGLLKKPSLVKIDILQFNTKYKKKKNSSIFIQVGAFLNPSNAKNFYSDLKKQNISAKIKTKNGFHKVLIGPYETQDIANDQATHVKQLVNPKKQSNIELSPL